MASWKKVLTADDVTNANIGSENLTIPNSISRELTLGNSSSKFRIKNSTGSNIFFQIQDDQVSLGVGAAACKTASISTGGSRITIKDDNTASFSLTSQFTITGTDTGSAAGPILKLKRDESDSSGAQDNDLIGQIKFSGDSDPLDPDFTLPTEVEYANIQCIARDTDATFDASDGGLSTNQDGKLQVNVAIDGTITPALTIDGQELHLHAEIEQHTFRLTSNETNGGTASPVIDLFSDSGSSAATDHIGEIRFRSDNGNSDPKTFADITAKIADPTNSSEDGEINFNVIKGGSTTEVMSITSAGNNAAGNNATENEQKLKGVEVHGSSLETLTRRYLFQFDFSESTPQSTSTSTTYNLDLDRSGIEPVHTDDDPNADVFGFIVPFKCFLTAATFAYKRNSSSSTNGHAKLEAVISHVDGSTDTVETMSSDLVNNNDFLRSSFVNLDSANQRRVELAPGDKIIPRVTLTSGSGTYKVIDQIGSFYLYTESSGL